MQASGVPSDLLQFFDPRGGLASSVGLHEHIAVLVAQRAERGMARLDAGQVPGHAVAQRKQGLVLWMARLSPASKHVRVHCCVAINMPMQR